MLTFFTTAKPFCVLGITRRALGLRAGTLPGPREKV